MKFHERQVARHYADALLGIIAQEGKGDEYKGELDKVVQALTGTKQLVSFWGNQRVPSSQKEELLREVMAAMEISPKLHAFLQVVLGNKRMGILPAMAEKFAELLDVRLGKLRAEVRSARPLSAETVEMLKEILEEKTGLQVELEVSEDPSLMAGIVLRMRNRIIDGSLMTKLLRFREALS